METLKNSLTELSSQLGQLSTLVNELRQRIGRLCQDSVWDINMLRQEMATQQNLRNLGRGLASKQDLSQALDAICQRLAALRFESHQEHQELLRFMDEGPYEPAAPSVGPSRRPASRGQGRHEHSKTLSTSRVLELEEVGAVADPSGPHITLANACAAGAER